MKYKKGTFVVVPNLPNLEGEPTELQTVFMWLCVYADDEGTCFPSRSALSRKCGITVKTVDKYITKLIDKGLIEKTKRKKKGQQENTSNLYQICVLDTLPLANEIPHPSELKHPTPSEPNNPITISNINYTNLTDITEVIEDKNAITLPLVKKDGSSTGKSNMDRLLYLYSKLFFNVYQRHYKPNWGRDKTLLRLMLKEYSEVQIAYMMCIYFNWHGMSGTDSRDYDFVTGATFPIPMFKTMANKFEIYITNVLGYKFDDDSEMLNKVGEHLRSIN